MSTNLRLWLVFSVLFVAACSPPIDTIKDQMLRDGQHPAFVEGFMDGYETGSLAGGRPWGRFVKNVKRYENDDQYRRGWDDGLQIFQGRWESAGH